MKKQTFWKSSDRAFFGIVLILIFFGLAAVSSASAVLSFDRFGNNNYYFFRQIIFVGAGLAAIFIVSRIDYHIWKAWSRPLMFAGLVLLAAVLLPQAGFQIGSSRSWFKAGSFFLQPSEFVKLAVIFYLASWFERKKEAESNFWFGILPPILVTGLAVALIIAQPDLGTAAVVAMIVFAVLFAAGARLPYLGVISGFGIAALWFLVKLSPSRAARIITFLDPSLDPRGIGYHINQAVLAIGSGGFWGYGYAASRQKHNYLPEPIGDSIFAVMAEELGFLRIVLLVGAFAALGILGIRIAKGAPDKFGQLTAIGITSWIVLQALINIGAISGLLPLTGITLPFISYGGSSMLSLCIAVGVILNISRQRA